MSFFSCVLFLHVESFLIGWKDEFPTFLIIYNYICEVIVNGDGLDCIADDIIDQYS